MKLDGWMDSRKYAQEDCEAWKMELIDIEYKCLKWMQSYEWYWYPILSDLINKLFKTKV